MKYDFDTPVDRRGTGCVKLELAESMGKSPDLLPLWIADMDFRVPMEAVDAIKARADHGVFGYTEMTSGYYDAVCSWMERRNGWRPKSEWLISTPGVVFALAAAVRAYTAPGDTVLIQPPVYYPFFEVVKNNGRVLAEAPLREVAGRYEMDFDALEREVERSRPKVLFLCNPHNPVGRVWSRGELERLGEICLKHNMIVVSDEIHADFNRAGFEHVSFASLGDEFAQRSVICTAPSKTFNLAGLQASNIFIPGENLCALFREEMARLGYDNANIMGLAAAEACFRHGDEWFDQLKEYLEGNFDFLRAFLRDRIPALKLVEPEGTYLAWVDCRGLGLSHDELVRFVEDEAGLWLDEGTMFGREGAGFMRINMATQRSLIESALVQLEQAVNARGR